MLPRFRCLLTRAKPKSPPHPVHDRISEKRSRMKMSYPSRRIHRRRHLQEPLVARLLAFAVEDVRRRLGIRLR